jgi:single-stranded DNA-binding protein
MSSEGKWVTLSGVIQFEPEMKHIDSLDQDVYEFSFRDASTQRRIKATLWEEHRSTYDTLEKGDAVIVDGKLKTNEGTNQDGQAVTYYNLSVSEIAVIKRQPKDEREKAAAAASSSGSDDGNDPW